MLKLEIKNRFTGKIIFTYEKENNTIKDTVLQALKEGANLRGADLGGAYLEGANLRGADLEGAYLEGADLRGADLEGAYLGGANLGGANLRGAYLRGAYLGGADLGYSYLRGAYLEGADLEGADLRDAKKVPMFCKWSTGITGDKIHIGCEKRNIKEWDKFFSSTDEIETKRDTQEFKQIEAVYNGLKSYYQHLNQ